MIKGMDTSLVTPESAATPPDDEVAAPESARGTHDRTGPSTSTVAVSVVIPTHGRPHLLRRCLEAVLGQTYPPDQYEVVVVEDGGPGEAQAVVSGFQSARQLPRLHYLAVPQGGPGAARNAGWRQATGQIVAFTDDDTIPDSGWLWGGVEALARGADAVCGRTSVPLRKRPTDAEANTQGLERASFATCNVLMRRLWLERLGGFDPQFRRAYREDSDLEFRLFDAGARLARAENALIVHPPRAERPFVSLRQQQGQMYDALLFKKHPRRFRETIRRWPPMAYYAITVSQVGSLAALLTGRPGLGLLFSLLWGGLCGRFFLRRARGRSCQPAHLGELAVTSVLIPPVAVYWRLRGAWMFRVWFF
jgi:hypothetical protein